MNETCDQEGVGARARAVIGVRVREERDQGRMQRLLACRPGAFEKADIYLQNGYTESRQVRLRREVLPTFRPA